MESKRDVNASGALPGSREYIAFLAEIKSKVFKARLQA